MEIEPADINQIRRARDGRMAEVDADAGNVARDLKAIDPTLKVRFAENGSPPFWAVYHEQGRDTYLVLTVRAHQTASGVWTGLDQRVVKRIMEIGHSTYDYADELERANNRVRDANRAKFRETVGASAELAAHAIRKDLGKRYRGRAFITTPLHK